MTKHLQGARRRIGILSMGLIAGLFGTGGADAAPGDLDFLFGQGGRAFINLDANNEGAASLLQQSDGKLLLGRATNFLVASTVDLSVVRLHLDGKLDASFSLDGVASTDLTGITASTRTVVQQASGGIVVAGQAWRDDSQDRTFSAITRYLPDGTLDSAFGSKGIVLWDASIEAMVSLPDGRLVAAGHADTKTGSYMAFTRFMADGSIDATFGSGGRLIVDPEGKSRAYDLVRRPDGRLIAVGTASNADGNTIAIVLSLTADGAVESSFGNGGRSQPIIAFGPMSSGPHVGLQSDGKVVVTGVVGQGFEADCQLVVARMDERGQVDRSFGSGGTTTFPVQNCFAPGDIFVAPDDQILLGGESLFDDLSGRGHWDYGGPPINGCPCDLEVFRLTASGSPDVSFGVNGKASIDVGVDDILSNVNAAFGTHLIRQTDGSIAIATTGVYDNEHSFLNGAVLEHSGIVVARLLDSGVSPGLIGFRAPVRSVPESPSSVDLVVQRTGGSAGTVSVRFATSDGSAVSGSDYSPASGTLTWADGDMTERLITIAILDDLDPEAIESVDVTLSSPTGGALLATSRGGVLILSTDPGLPNATGPVPRSATGGGGGAVDWASLILVLVLVVAAKRRIHSIHVKPCTRLTRDHVGKVRHCP